MTQLARPIALKVVPSAIPDELKDDQWVNWRSELRPNGKGEQRHTKPPLKPSGEYAKSTDATTWSPFSEVMAAYARGDFDGIGRVFCSDDPYVVVDLDHCRNPANGTVDRCAIELIRLLRSYTEVSPSGAGVRIVVRAKLPADSRNRTGNIEIYDNARYATFTGYRLPGAVVTVEPRQDEVEEFQRRVFPAEPKAEVHNTTDVMALPRVSMIRRCSSAHASRAVERSSLNSSIEAIAMAIRRKAKRILRCAGCWLFGLVAIPPQ